MDTCKTYSSSAADFLPPIGMTCCGKPETQLAEYAQSLQQKASKLSPAFPMYVVSLQNILKMTEVRCHQDLLRDGILVKMDAVRGKAMFISHQWVSNQHPDPDGQQLKVFQGAMSNLLNGSIPAQPGVSDAFFSAFLGWPGLALPDLSASTIFVWYDYFCIPQHTISADSRSFSQNSFEAQRKAIGSIPAYVDRCDIFVVLCPLMKHATTHSTLHYDSWAERGWCRTEAMTRNLSVKNGCVLFIHGPRHIMLGSTWHSTFLAPGDGQFTVDADREVVGKIIKDMVEMKLHSLLVKGDLPGFRLLLNLQHVWLRKCDITPVPGLLAGDFSTDSGEIGEEFLLQHGFSHVEEYDKAGWSPLCYAALGGNSPVLEALLSQRANPNETLRRSCPALYLFKGTSALSICSRSGNSEAVRILLHAQADPNQADSIGQGALTIFAWNPGNITDMDGARSLLEARANPNQLNAAGSNAFQTASFSGNSKLVKELLPFSMGATSKKDEVLPWAIFFGLSSTEHISLLLEAGVDINEQWQMRLKLPGVGIWFGFLAAKHCLSETTGLNTFAYHWHDATPLMLSILVGSYSISWLLLEAKARIDLRNSRKQTAFDLAIKRNAPHALLWELWKRGAGNHASRASISWWHSNTPEEPIAEDQASITVESSIPMEGMVQDFDPMVSMQF